jgi:DNA polymerase-3 subunit epsilon
MIVMGVDTETTGLEQEKGHRIIEIALVSYDLESRKLMDRYVQRIDPERPIDSGAQAAHGISYTELVGQPKWEDVAEEINRRLGGTDLLVAHNMGFDGPFIAGELLRVGLQPPNVHSVCTMENARWACPDGKLPRLGELCFALGVGYDRAKAHAAEYDIEVTMACFFRGLDRGFYELPKKLKGINEFKNCHDAPGAPA